MTAQQTDPLRNAPAGGDAAAITEQLPAWSLGDLFAGPESAELKAARDGAKTRCAAFRETYAGKIADLDAEELARAVADYETLDEALDKLSAYAFLTYAGNVSDERVGQFYQEVREAVTEAAALLIFFTIEINQIDDRHFEKLLADPALARYEPWLRDVRLNRPHQLSDEMERLVHELDVAGSSAWIRLFDETIAGLRFPINGKELTEAEALNLLSDADRATREAAAKSIGAVFGDRIRLFATITNTLAKDKSIKDKWRGFDRPVSARNLANRVEDTVVDALVDAVRSSFPALSHRYYQMKAGWLGLDKLKAWDRNAPLPSVEERRLTWPQARQAVLDAYARFSPDMAAVGKRFFEEGWIDAQVRPGKMSGAFSHPTVPGAHPYILMSYQGRTRDVMTLAHELGHGVHQVLAADQGHLLSQTPLTLAETASVFGEMLTFRSLLDAETDPARRKAMLAGKVEDMLNTVVRQIAFYEFERRVHDERKKGELLAERICEIWLAVQTESLGPAFDFDEGYKYYWAYIPHFIHSPFYVYAYAFGDCLVNSLYAVYQDADEGFAERYLDMLRAGGSKHHKALLAPFGLDASDPAFWHKGLGIVSGMIDELAALDGA